MSWDDNIKVELINHQVYMMAPPSVKHQSLVGKLYTQLRNFLEGKPCEVYSGVGVRLNPKNDDSDGTTVIPDLIVVCDEEKLKDDRAVKGAPDFIIEILSLNNRGHDLITKKDLYEEAGVKEYWVIDQIKHNKIYKYILLNGSYFENLIDLSEGLKVPVEIIKGCFLEF